jgi:sugar/nucleoside kinase (ribokinase family)
VKPNQDELWNVFRDAESPTTTGDPPFILQLALRTARHVFHTHGSQGMAIAPPSRNSADVTLIPSYRVSGPIDIVGAGDSCSAGIASAMVSGATHEQAAAFGNLVASITIQQIGVTGTATPDQVRARWREVQGSPG